MDFADDYSTQPYQNNLQQVAKKRVTGTLIGAVSGILLLLDMQQLSDFFSPCVFFRRVISSCHNVNLQSGVTTMEVYINSGMVSKFD